MTSPSIQDVRAAIRILFKPDQVVELRAIGSSGLKAKKTFILSGYYSDSEILARDAIQISERPDVTGVFWTIQEIKTELLARSANRYRTAKQGDTTADLDVASFRWLPIDVDPVRPSGISSSDGEKHAAREVVQAVGTFFRELGVNPIAADSGNGFHLLIPIAIGPDRADLLKAVLAALAARFDTAHARIDRTIFNAARILKVYGTVARKGEPTENRPHRLARLLKVPDVMSEPLSIDVLEKIAAGAPGEPAKKKKGTKADEADFAKGIHKVEEFLKAGSVEYLRREEYAGGYKWILTSCPFNPAHVATSVIVTIAETGAMGFKCSHNSCYDKHWDEFRAYMETKIGHRFEFKERSPEEDENAIRCGPGHLLDMVKRSEQVLDTNYKLKYFERHGDLINTVYARDTPKMKDVERDGDSVIIQPASGAMILRDLDSKAVYLKQRKGKWICVDVPGNLPAQIHDRVRSAPRDVPFESLDMVSGAPVLLPSGKVHDYGSIFEESVMFINAHTNRYPHVPDFPTRENALIALKEFETLFHKFPFVDPGITIDPLKTASYSVALSGVLSLAARPYMGIGAIPIHCVTAHAPRSGKTKIVETCCVAALGHKPTVTHYRDEEEFSKGLQPLLQAGDRAILLDNLERSLQSSKLCILVTGGVLRDRVLGESRDVLLKNFSVFFATGNNLNLSGDLCSRAIRCDIDPAMEFPESRGFEFDPVERARELHPALVTGALTMLRAYVVAGMPWKLKREPWGGFRRWDLLVCGCLDWLGMADPYLSRERVLGDDPVRMSNLDLLEDWYARYGSRSISFNDIRNDKGAVYEGLLKSGVWDGHHAQWILRRLQGRNIGGYTLTRADGRSCFRVLKSGDQISFDEAMVDVEER